MQKRFSIQKKYLAGVLFQRSHLVLLAFHFSLSFRRSFTQTQDVASLSLDGPRGHENVIHIDVVLQQRPHLLPVPARQVLHHVGLLRGAVVAVQAFEGLDARVEEDVALQVGDSVEVPAAPLAHVSVEAGVEAHHLLEGLAVAVRQGEGALALRLAQARVHLGVGPRAVVQEVRVQRHLRVLGAVGAVARALVAIQDLSGRLLAKGGIVCEARPARHRGLAKRTAALGQGGLVKRARLGTVLACPGASLPARGALRRARLALSAIGIEVKVALQLVALKVQPHEVTLVVLSANPRALEQTKGRT